MIFSVSETIARLSTICPLLAGDLIFTGTPAGVGNRMDPPRHLQPGDELISTSEGKRGHATWDGSRRPEDVAGAALFLATDDAIHITGS